MAIRLKTAFDKDKRFLWLASHGFFNNMTDEDYCKRKFEIFFGYPLNLDNPQTYNEKLQWLKLHDRKPIYTTMVDKYEAKGFVASIIGEEYIIPTLGVWEHFEDIDFEILPDQFVLKCTHDSGGLVVVKDKNEFDINTARKRINKALKKNYFDYGREWPYKNVKPRIIAEKYMEDESGFELKDFKFFCFNGVPKLLFVACDRGKQVEETKFNFYDMDFNLLPFTNGHPNAPEGRITKPETFEEMKEIAAELSKNCPHVRVDLYSINGKTYFGELTFYHWSGFKPFDPPEWDKRIGDLLQLPNVVY